jgi:hypothetical protein
VKSPRPTAVPKPMQAIYDAVVAAEPTVGICPRYSDLPRYDGG